MERHCHAHAQARIKNKPDSHNLQNTRGPRTTQDSTKHYVRQLPRSAWPSPDRLKPSVLRFRTEKGIAADAGLMQQSEVAIAAS